ncbi:MAG: class I SAM-dependent methyltransferase [Gammaproteobacteria bacterium]
MKNKKSFKLLSKKNIHQKIEEFWNQNADIWCESSESHKDVYRDHVNTPAFLKMLPDISKKIGLDVGCGCGYNTRFIAKRCEHLSAIDLSEKFIEHNKVRLDNPKNISFEKMNLISLNFPDEHFDFATSTMTLMSVADLKTGLSEIYRVLKPNGFFQFSITHPCFNDSVGGWLNKEDLNEGFLVKDYLAIKEGHVEKLKHVFSSDNHRFQVPRFSKPIYIWINLLLEVGFSLDEICEPSPSAQKIKQIDQLKAVAKIPLSMIVRVKKNENNQSIDNVIGELPGNVWWKDRMLRYLGCNNNVVNMLNLASKDDLIGKTRL